MPPWNHSRYFFDLPVADISGSVCNALRVMYHGCIDGAFGRRTNERIDLNQIKAIKIQVIHATSEPLSEDFEYNLVFYRKSMGPSIWDPSSREKQSQLKALTRRVQWNEKKSVLSRRVLDNLWIRLQRPIYFAKFEERVLADHYVPVSYHQQLFRDFEPYIMRTSPDFPLVRTLFRAQGLDLAERRLVSHPSDTSNRILTYTLAPASIVPKPDSQELEKVLR